MAKSRKLNPPRLPAPYDPASDIIRPKHLPHATGLSAVTVWRERQAGRFPEPQQLTPGGSKGWTRDQINEWRASLDTPRPKKGR